MLDDATMDKIMELEKRDEDDLYIELGRFAAEIREAADDFANAKDAAELAESFNRLGEARRAAEPYVRAIMRKAGMNA